jgi:CRISPR-associated protein Cas2
MSESIHRYVVAYDVASDARRIRVAKTLGSYGDRLQYSVFVVDTRPAGMVRLKGKMVADLHLPEDSLLICHLGPLLTSGGGRTESIGLRRPLTGDGPLVL